jgi:hypothetical protein
VLPKATQTSAFLKAKILEVVSAKITVAVYWFCAVHFAKKIKLAP